MNRTIENLRNGLNGKVYVKFSSKEIAQRFLDDAEAEGYLLGEKKPSEVDVPNDFMAIEEDKKICYTGIAAHIAIGSHADYVHVIDYEKYVNGDDFFFIWRD